MEAVLLIGIQGAGKSTFYERRFANTHLRISRDVCGTAARERQLLKLALDQHADFVIDNTNATVANRAAYIAAARAAQYRVVGYFFEPDAKASLARNNTRSGKARIPPAGLFGTLKRLQRPHYEEGFEDLYHVIIRANGEYAIGRLPDSVSAPATT